MDRIENDDIVELGVASVETRGGDEDVIEPGGKLPQRMGLAQDD